MSSFGLAFGVMLLIFSSLIYPVVRMLRSDPSFLKKALSEVVDCREGEPVLVPSSSRLIALAGLIVILAVDGGIATVILHRLAEGAPLPELDKVNYFLICQAGLFAPYAVSKLAEVIRLPFLKKGFAETSPPAPKNQ
ncbi:hypothetical protein [Ammonifex thiophilus]|uniref:Uncharacterized protein n=1 Tax=Ammonifex thiophilus TaxID=444093 RepID=A0A3D8P779_9THEO|nr:hypothetical protein [Ammonifex thiophilus]RDV84712.1 hypothetical protein DXX99_01285 [Ammonifex thiophilus]